MIYRPIYCMHVNRNDIRTKTVTYMVMMDRFGDDADYADVDIEALACEIDVRNLGLMNWDGCLTHDAARRVIGSRSPRGIFR